MAAVRALSVSPKEASKCVLKSFMFDNNGDDFSMSGANQSRAGPDKRVPMNPIFISSVVYVYGNNWNTNFTWLTNPRNFRRFPSNLSGILILGSWVYVGGST